jgi:hypothetical protein
VAPLARPRCSQTEERTSGVVLLLRDMRGVSRRRGTFVALMLVAPSACSLLVPTGGLTGGGGDGSPGNDASTLLLDEGPPPGDTSPARTAPDDAVAADTGGAVAADTGGAVAADTGGAPDARVDTGIAGDDGAPDSPTCTPVLNGLIGHWTMDVSTISGTSLADTSGNHYDGTLVGFAPPETAPGQFGDALVYPVASDAYVHVPVLPLDTTAGGVNTISMWFYRNGQNVNDVLALLPNSPRYDLWLTSNPGGAGTDTFLCINTGHNDCIGVEDDTLLDRWVHVVVVFVNGPTGQGKLYIDGQSRPATCLTSAGFASCTESAVAAAPVDLGGETDFYFHGMIDDVRIYDRALGAGEVSALYAGTACP